MGLFSKAKKEAVTLDKPGIVALAQAGANGAAAAAPAAGADDDIDLPWHAVPDAADVVSDLASDAAHGLTAAEAKRRLADYGPNALTPPRKATFLERLWAQLNNIVIWILLAAAVIEAAFQSWAEFVLVILVIVANTAIGLVQEGKAEKAADAIKAMLSPTAKVRRDGEPQVVNADELVPGDIVLLKSGDKVPADVRLISAVNLQVQEAMLTGESVPVSKDARKSVGEKAPLGDRRNMAYSATAVVAGQAEGIVVATGDAAEIGQISKMVNTVETMTNNLTRQMDIFGRWLSLIVLFIIVLAFLLAKFRANESWQGAFESAVSIAVAVIPEGLPAMVTVVLAIGTTVMARNNAIIRQLPAVETLGSVNVICSDKTGTLTKNEMTAVRVRTAAALYHVGGVGYAPEGEFTFAADDTKGDEPGAALSEAQRGALQAMLEGGMLCNDSALTRSVDEATGTTVYSPTGAPTEVALITAGQKLGLDLATLKAAKPRVASVPFESEHKFMATVHDDGSKRVMFVKGASDRLLPMCKTQVVNDDLNKTAPLNAAFWNKAQADLSAQGLRVLALCRAEVPKGEPLDKLSAESLQKRPPPNMSLVAMFAILDPPRTEVIESIKEAHRAGITVKMITGDHALTALAIGKMLNIAGPDNLALTGPEVDAMDDTQLKAIAPSCNIYARASPENKIRIVRALQDATPRRIVSMTGDGVNDAPALKAADVGVAMGITGTDVSKEAAKMVLADDNFKSIVAAVKEGRRVWDNIVRLLLFNLPVNIAQGMSVVWSYILGFHEAPLTVLQILLVNMVTSTTLGMALAAEPAEPDVMERAPRPADKRLIGKTVLWRMVFVSHVIVALVLGAFYWAEKQGFPMGERRAEAFNVLVAAQIGYFITCRFLKLSTFHPRVLFGNWLAYASIALTVGIMVFFTYVPKVNTFFHMEPLPAMQWSRIVVAMVITWAVVEVEKALIDPIMVPLVAPVTNWINKRAPKWLRADNFAPHRVAGRLCMTPRTASMQPQRRGTMRKSSSAAVVPAEVIAAAAAATGDRTSNSSGTAKAADAKGHGGLKAAKARGAGGV